MAFGLLAGLLASACVLESVVASSGSAPLNTVVSMVTYLGDGNPAGVNKGQATAVDGSGNIYVAGAGHFNFGLTPTGDTTKAGYILQLSGSNLHPLRIFRYGANISAIRIRETTGGKRILVQSDLGVAVMNDNFQQQLIVASGCAASDCVADLGRDGTIAVLRRTSRRMEVFVEGQLSASLTLGSSNHMDVAVDPVNRLVIHGHYFQSNPHHIPVQVPCLTAYNYTLGKVWTDYCVSGEEDYQTQNMADSRVNHLYFSDVDNKLYAAGYTDGGNSIFRYNPTDIAQNSGSLAGLSVMPNDVKPHYDVYTDLFNMHGANAISFLARYNPADGHLEKGQFMVTRLSSGSGNGLNTDAVAAGAGGTLVAGQSAVASLEHRANQTVNGLVTAGYGGSDAALLVVSPDFMSRLVWTQFQKTSGHSRAVAVAANAVNGKTRVAFLAASKDSEFIQIRQLTGTGHASTTAVDQFALVVLDV